MNNLVITFSAEDSCVEARVIRLQMFLRFIKEKGIRWHSGSDIDPINGAIEVLIKYHLINNKDIYFVIKNGTLVWNDEYYLGTLPSYSFEEFYNLYMREPIMDMSGNMMRLNVGEPKEQIDRRFLLLLK